MSVKVTLREKPISKGRKSLYLDFYPAIELNGKKTRREFLGMYVLADPSTVKEKRTNKETREIASSIRSKRNNELNKPEVYTAYEKELLKNQENGELNFIEYFEKQLRKRHGTNLGAWTATYKHLKNFAGDELKFKDLTIELLEGFKVFLLNSKRLRSKELVISTNGAASYFSKVKATLKQAYKESILTIDLNARVEGIRTTETHREYLNLEELNRLIETPCKNEELKRAAFFSALTSLRFGDIKKLTWKEFEYSNETDGYSMKVIINKSKGAERMPISEQAYKLLGEKGELDELIFKELQYSDYNNRILKAWVEGAGITKKIGFHNFRHTFATLQLANDTAITTVQRMMGHKDIKTTMIYAKVVDRAKKEAADKIKLKFD
ncbi:MAG: integrase [Crocinitomix sp.]|jgi:integrase